MKLKKYTQKLIVIFLFLSAQWSYAQVTGISYTISPTVEYNWWDDKSGLDDGLMLGGKLGIGFGEFLELQGTYMQAINQKTNFENFGLLNYSDSLFIARDVKVTRLGGSLKANLSRGKMLPFLTLGTGIQSIKLDTFATNKNIFVNFGAGVVFSIADRYTFTLVAKNTPFNFNSGRALLTAADKSTFEVSDADFQSNRLDKNWSLSASLQFYMGGRRPGQLSELDKAYMATFSDGLRGLRVPVEPTLAKMNFDNDLPYKDTWMVGGFTGIDFNDYIGVRAFYFKAMENNEISSKFDDLSMFGGEMRMKLNAARGLTPYLSIGGGYLNVDEEKYAPRDSVQAKSQAFASGGIGISVPLAKRFNIFGSARAVLTSGTKADNLQTTDEIQTSTMYTVGMRFILGKKSDPNAVFQSEVNTALAKQQTENDEKALKLKQEYEAKVIDTEAKLNEAYAQQDVEKAAALLKEKEEAESVVAELEKREVQKSTQVAVASGQQTPASAGISVMPSNSRIQMSPAEFENLIEEILESMGPEPQYYGNQQHLMYNNQNTAQQSEIDRRIAEMEKLILQMNGGQAATKDSTSTTALTPETTVQNKETEFFAKLLLEVQKINDKVDQNNKEIQSLKEGGAIPRAKKQTTELLQPTDSTAAPTSTSVTEDNTLGVKTSLASRLSYEGMSGFVGATDGDNTIFTAGLRWYYGIGNSKFEMMPEIFVAFSTPSSYGVSVNALRPFTIKKSRVTPYIGVGGGFMQIAEEITAEDKNNEIQLNYNFIVGTYLNVFKGRLFVDYTSRNLFDYHQVIAGYRFSF